MEGARPLAGASASGNASWRWEDEGEETEDAEEQKEAVTVVEVEEEGDDSAGGIDTGLHEEKVEDSIWANWIWSFLTQYSSL